MNPPQIPLEDSWTDVLGKAANGLKFPPDRLADACGCRREEIEGLLEGRLDADLLKKAAAVLGLSAEKLAVLARGDFPSPGVVFPDGVLGFNTDFGGMTVNSYLIWDPATGEAAAFDTGADCDPLVEAASARNLAIRQIFLTHSHGDHVIDLDRLVEKTRAAAWIGEREPLAGASPFPEGRVFQIGGLRVDTALTWGHSPGGITYIIGGLASPAAVVGDSIFVGSAGGGRHDYGAALSTIRERILTLPADTILLPGHGPATTVAHELANNPFF